MAYIGKRPGDTFPSDNAITTTLVADNAITAVKIAENAITSREIAANSIATGNIADNAVDGTKIAQNSILTKHIDDNQITADQIANDAVGLAQLAGIARGKIIYGDTSGNPAVLAPGSNGQVLKSDGTDIAWDTDEGKTSEEIQDIVGAMFSSNTETGISATYEDGDGTIDLVVGTLNQDTTGTADNITVSANNSTDETVYPIFVDGATGSQGAESDTGLTYNPSTGMLTTTGVTATITGNVTGNLTGNASGTAATVTTAAQPNITSLGTLTALTVDDIAVDGKVITMTGSTGDTATLTAGTDGTLTIATTDTAAAAANIQITADGTAELAGTTVTLDSAGGITLDADGGTITFADGGSSLGTITSAGWSGAIADNSVTSAKIANGTIVSADIAANTIATSNIADNAIDATKIAQNSILTRHIDDAQVTNDHLAGSIANSKLANSAITISDGSNSTATALGGTMTFAGTSNEVEVSESSGTVTIGLPNDVTIAGDLTVSGTTTTVSSTTINVADPLIALATTNNSADAVDIGLYGLYDTSGSQDLYSGLFRDANDSGKWKLFKDLQAAPTTTVNTGGTGYAKGTLVADIEGNVTGNITGTVNTAAQTSITSLGTLTALTVDNVVIDGAVIGHTGDTDLMTLSSGVLTVAGEVDATSLDISGDADIDGTLEADAITVDGTALAEVIADTAGAMFSSNTESGITVTYQDGDNTIDLSVDAAQTGITSLLATDIKIGEDDQTKIDFETADEIHFFAANQQQFDLVDGAIVPTTDNDVDLGTSAKEFKDGYFDGTVYADAINFDGTAISATAAELNIMDGVTATTAELNIMDGVTSTAAELNILDGVTSTATELNLLDGSTANTVVNSKAVVYGSSGELAGTLSTAAQTNITSLGTLTTLTVDDITINGSTISDAADLTIDAEGDINLDANGADIRIKDGGTEYGAFTNSSSDFVIRSRVDNKDIVFKGEDDSTEKELMRLDMSEQRVGINQSSPASDLHITNASDCKIILESGTDEQSFVGHSGGINYNVVSGDSHTFTVAGTDHVTMNATGLGVGTTTPDNAIHVHSASGDGVLKLTGDGNEAKGAKLVGHDGGITIQVNTGSNNSYSERMRIDTSGRVGIGSNNPQTLLHLYKSTGSGALEPELKIQNDHNTTSTTDGAGRITFYSNDTNNAGIPDGAWMGQVRFMGDDKDGSATEFEYAYMVGIAEDPGSGTSRRGGVDFYTRNGNSMQKSFQIKGAGALSTPAGDVSAHNIVTSAPSSGSGKQTGHVWYVV